MDGMFKIQLIQNRYDKNIKWIIRKKNIDFKNKKYYGWVMNFGEGYMPSLDDIEKLCFKFNGEYNAIDLYPSDTFRNFRLQEYLKLGNTLRQYGYIYNKKNDMFTVIKKKNSK